MKFKFIMGLILAVLQCLLVGSAANASMLTIVGVCTDNDGTGCDADPEVGIILLLAATPAGFIGAVREIETSTSYRIIASPATLRTAGTDTFTGHYGSFIGPGVLRAVVNGVLTLAPGGVFPDLTGGTEFVGVATFASSFDNSPAITSGTAAAGLPIPFNLSGSDTNEGNYNGSGTMTAFLSWRGLTSAGGQPEQIFLPTSAEYLATVPEPGILFIFATGVCLVVFGQIRSRHA